MALGRGEASAGNSVDGAWRPDIDGLRAVAIIFVLLFHYYPNITNGGFVGVDIFFVISGYLITSDLLRRRAEELSVRTSIIAFYQRRIRRIFPALLALLIVVGIYGWFFLLPTDFGNLAKYIAAGGGFATNFVLWSEAGYFDGAISQKPLAHLWSLAIEEQFYIVWPLLLLVLSRTSRSYWLPLVIALLVVASFCYCIFITNADSTAAYYSPLSRGWELGVGGLLAIAHRDGRRAPQTIWTGAAALGGLAAICWAACAVTEAQFPGWQAALPVGGAAAIIWFARGTWVDRFLLGLPPVRYVGLISYPLYLWHWTLLSFFRIYNPGASPFFARTVFLVASVILAVGTFHLIERPIRRQRVELVAGISLALMLCVLGAAAAASVFGWAGISLNAEQRALIQPIATNGPYRYKTCLLDTATQKGTDFADECRGAPGRPELLLWGDSQAASFYSGLKARSDVLAVSISQRTASTCAPSVVADQPKQGHCDEINASTRHYIAAERPAIVLIHSRWAEHGDPLPRITALVQFLRQSGVQSIIIAGPSPIYRPSLQGVLIHDHLFDPELPRQLSTQPSTWAATRALNDQLRSLARSLGIGFVSLLDRFCGEASCQIRVTDQLPDGLLLTDYDHISPVASVSLFSDLQASDLDLSVTGSRLVPR